MYDVNKNKEELDATTSSKYYGQWETDKFIEKYFPNQSKGYCIEVGAADGIKGSNTKYFEDLGWDALCIEPNKLFSESLEKHRKVVRYYAVGDSNLASVSLQIFNVGDKEIMSSLTFNKRHVQRECSPPNITLYFREPCRRHPFL